MNDIHPSISTPSNVYFGRRAACDGRTTRNRTTRPSGPPVSDIPFSHFSCLQRLGCTMYCVGPATKATTLHPVRPALGSHPIQFQYGRPVTQ